MEETRNCSRNFSGKKQDIADSSIEHHSQLAVVIWFTILSVVQLKKMCIGLGGKLSTHHLSNPCNTPKLFLKKKKKKKKKIRPFRSFILQESHLRLPEISFFAVETTA